MTVKNQKWQNDMIAVLPKLRRFAYSLTGSPDDADDLMQMTVEKALKHSQQYVDGTSMENWMFRICKNQWIDEWRKRDRREKVLALNKDVFASSVDGVREADVKLEFKETHAAMARLSDDQRQIIALIAVEGKSYRETAEILGKPIGTVMSRLARARAALCAHLPDRAQTVK
jgi:RNA polymerase sigma factor (sigma-70 family)